jgi:hypothetical protein
MIDVAEAATRKIGPLPAIAWGGIVGGGILVFKFLRGGSGGASSQFGQVVGGGNIDFEDGAGGGGGNPAGGGSGDIIGDIDPIGTISCGPRPLMPEGFGYDLVCVPGVGWRQIPTPGYTPPTGDWSLGGLGGRPSIEHGTRVIGDRRIIDPFGSGRTVSVAAR